MAGDARVIRPDRRHVRWDMIDLDSLLPMDHRARVVWSFVETLNLSPLYEAIRAREGEPGRPPPDPAVLLALWLFATVEGVGSARELDRLVERDVAYRWLAGGVALNYHGLSDFRVDHTELLDVLLRDSVTALIAEGVVSLEEIVVDGTKACPCEGGDQGERRAGIVQGRQDAGEGVGGPRVRLRRPEDRLWSGVWPC